ncbi:acyl dehydratase [Paraburkholderia sp. BL27I4N3]|uniref:MaoC/PaaZ C-terminal domain-containing protein n=1 Tax=Paraburkholderia sp. BL27I4N3 TaxID=1938805 RepID=UPI000E265C93|nr:MaoC/PaaZ C-terminal domain-containing protein [Paraburkholderia sp. BL27I4N3]REE07397.1 acyl dehydratase [Paraburkholderia sp. BL27I4N3]
MAIDYQRLLERRFEPIEHAYSRRDSILYALGIGLGADPLDPRQLAYVYEEGLRALPTLPVILAYPGFWAKEPDTGIDWRRLVHAEQSFELHAPLAPEGRVIGHNRITSIFDKGAEKGALLTQQREIVDTASGALLATVSQVSLLRGDGGFGGPRNGAPPAPHVVPERQPDASCDLPTLPQAALIYRLSGDTNPLHVDPTVAQGAGFTRPILHGLCTMGVACHAAMRALFDYNASCIRSMRVRFTAPVLPGDTLRTELWQDGDIVSFRTIALERRVTVLSAGRIDTQLH